MRPYFGGGWQAAVWWIWLAWFVVWESVALFTRHGMTLTFFMEHHVPRWVLAAFIGWISFHFLVAPPALKIPKIKK